MQKLSAEEASQMPKKYRGNLSPAYIAILNLQPSENLHLAKEEWTPKYPISRVIRKIGRKFNRQYTLTHLAEGKGYLISRIR